MKKESFTLMETILALSIMTMILGTVYAFYNYSMQLTVSGREKLDDVQIARVILHKIAFELKAVTSSGSRFTSVLDGESDRIGFITTAIPSRLVFFPVDMMDRGKPIEHDLRRVEYFIARSEDRDKKVLGLERDELRCLLTPLIEKKDAKDLTPEEIAKDKEEREKFKVHLDLGGNKALSEQPIIQQMLISEKIKFLRFDYYDGKEWINTWKRTGSDAIPRAIQVTIGFKEMSEEDFKHEQSLPMDQRPWHEDHYTLLISLILSDDLKAEFSGKGEESK
jgi:hypothetical protein